MARISLAEAMKLGIVPPRNEGRAATKKTPSASKRATGEGRRSAKGGRLARTDTAPLFEVRFEIPLEPKTKERPRTSLPKAEIERMFHQSGGSFPKFKALLDGLKHRTYTPADTSSFEGTVAMIAAGHMRGSKEPYALPVHVDFVFVMTGETDAWPTDVTDPDLDNMEKAICDALNKVVWKDDRLMVSKRSIKVCGPRPGIRVRVRDAVSARDEFLSEMA